MAVRNTLTETSDITSEQQVGDSLQASRDSLYWIGFFLSQLNNTAANITIRVYISATSATKSLRRVYEKVIAKPAATDTGFFYTIPQPIFLLNTYYMKVTVESTNSSDTAVVSAVYIVDPYADGYDTNDIRKISVEDWGDVDVSAKVSGGYAQVDAVKVGSADPQSLYALETDVAAGTHTTTVFTISAGVQNADAYNDMLISVEDALDSHKETRRIIDWTAARQVTVDTAFSFTPAEDDVVHIMENMYGDVDVGKIEGSDATDQINAACDTALTDLDVAATVHDEVIEGSITLRQAIRLFLAVLTGKASGGGTSTITFRDTEDSKDRVIVTVDTSGNRTAVGTRDGS